MEQTVGITQVPTKSEVTPSLLRISLRQDLFDTSGRSVEHCTVLPVENSQSNEAGCDLSQKQVPECEPSGPPSLFNVAPSSCLFLPQNVSRNECEEHFEVDRLLDGPENRKEMNCHVDVEHSISEETVSELKEENLRNPLSASLTKPNIPLCENVATGSAVKVSLHSELDLCSVKDCEENLELDRSFNDPEDRKEVKLDIVEHSICEETGGEGEEENPSSFIPSILRGKNTAACFQNVEDISLSGEGNWYPVCEGEAGIKVEESPDGAGDCVETKNTLESVMLLFAKEETGERSLEAPWEVQSSSGGAIVHRGENMPNADCSRPFVFESSPRHKESLSEKKYECSLCKIRFSRKDLDIHMLFHKHKCSECDKWFSFKGDLNKHMRSHTGEKPYQCSICGKNFSQKGNLNRHIRFHAGEKPFQCFVCKRSFSLKLDVTKHMRSHTGEKPYQCPLCEKRYSLKGDVTRHMRVHTGEKPFQCSVCGKVFSLKCDLDKHMRAHKGEKHYECSVCQSRFQSKDHLRAHIRSHTGEKPFQCSVCGKNFTLKGGANRHMRLHTGEKPFHCSVCDKSFSRNSDLILHVRVHTGEKPFQCSVCRRRFSDKVNMMKHARAHRRKTLQMFSMQ